MYGPVDGRRKSVEISLDPEVVERLHETRRGARRRSLIRWGEHCTECAFPVCYASCAFYTPRPDLHCRRFEDGFEPVTAGDLSLTRIRFRRWAKLEGFGPAALFAQTAVDRRVRRDEIVAGLADKLPLRRRAVAGLMNHWNRHESNLSLGELPVAGTHFVIEAWISEGDRPIPLTLTLAPVDKAERGLFQDAFTLAPGYNRVMIPVERISAFVDVCRPHFIQIEPLAEVRVAIVFGLVDFAETIDLVPVSPSSLGTGAELASKHAKCIVWDLDNTLWNGTLAEDGIEGLTIRETAVATIRALDERGMLHAVASKNDDHNARAALDHFGVSKYFVESQIGWGPKSASLSAIAQRLNIGLDTFIFIDDQQFERGEVSAVHPSVECLPDTAVGTLEHHPRCAVPVTLEASRRRQMYREQQRRADAEQQAETDYHCFLRSCDLKLTIRPLSPELLVRASELSERTNQLNFAGTRITIDALAQLMRPERGTVVHLLHCTDRFGDYGIIGLSIIDVDAARIIGFMMSCRVQRKLVEQAYFGYLGIGLQHLGKQKLDVDFRETPRNCASRMMLQELGFQFAPGENPGSGAYRRSLAEPWADTDIVTIVDLTGGLAEPAIVRCA